MESIDVPSMENLVNSSANVSELMNFDAYAGWCNSPNNLADQIAPSLSANFSPFDGLNFIDPYSGISVMNGGIMGKSPGDRDKLVFPFRTNSDADGTSMIMMIPRSPSQSLAEKMLRAMHFFKELSGEGLLAQLWVPMRSGNQYILTTSEQPYLLDQNLMGYREVSRLFTFSAESETSPFTGLPGRVFNSRIPEWTSNVMYYNEAEYLRIQHAADHKVRGTIALPVFEDDSLEMSCCAVLELVTMKEKPNFDLEMENICRALEAVNLRSKEPPRLCSQSLSKNQRAALAEVTEVLHAVCHAHQLPLALTWIPCNYSEGPGDSIIKMRSRGHKSPNEKCVLCIEDTACYVNNKDMQSFVHACAEHYLEEGQGIVGKAIQSNHPFFYPDVKKYHVSEYPLVHHARKFGLRAAIAIRLRSAYTCDDDYILEFFLPVDMKGSTEQQILLSKISISMQRLCKSLRTVSDAELLRVEDFEDKIHDDKVFGQRSCEQSLIDRDSSYVYRSIENTSELKGVGDGLVDARSYEQPIAGSRKQKEKKRSTSEKHVSLSVIQQHFSGSLKDAAKNIGVCPTTLKRICRQYGISRWPSRKINKVNRSLRKIQSMLDTVEGVDGGLQFDPITGGFIVSPDTDRTTRSSNLGTQSSKSIIATIEEECIIDGNQVAGANCTISPKAPESSFLSIEDYHGWVLNNSTKADASRSSNSTVDVDIETRWKDDCGMDMGDGVVEHNQPTSSGTTNSANGSRFGSGSMTNDSSLSFGEGQNPEIKTSYGGSESKITVKASYKEDTVRFKFEHSAGCMQLYEEVAKRFNLQMRQFQLKYVDDEEEWVILENDSDLVECIEVLNFAGKQSIKLMVRDVPCIIGSSSGSYNFLGGI